VNQIKGNVRKISARDSTTLQPFNAAARPFCPSAAAVIMAGMMDMVRVRIRRRKGDTRQFIAPSQIICPAMVATIPALIPENNRDKAKIVPVPFPMVSLKSLYRPGRSASASSVVKNAPATIKTAELTKTATTKRTMQSSAMV